MAKSLGVSNDMACLNCGTHLTITIVMARQTCPKCRKPFLIENDTPKTWSTDRLSVVGRPTVDRGLIVAFSVAMPKLPEELPVSPMSVTCPRCHANPGLNCVQLADKVEAIHIERIEAAAKKTRERGPS